MTVIPHAYFQADPLNWKSTESLAFGVNPYVFRSNALSLKWKARKQSLSASRETHTETVHSK